VDPATHVPLSTAAPKYSSPAEAAAMLGQVFVPDPFSSAVLSAAQEPAVEENSWPSITRLPGVVPLQLMVTVAPLAAVTVPIHSVEVPARPVASM